MHHDAPAGTDVADQPFVRHPDVVEEHLSQLAATAGERDRSHRDPGSVGIDHEGAQTAMAALGGARARQHHEPGSGRTLTGPDLLPVQNEAAGVVVRGPASQPGQVATRLRLGEALPPPLGAAEVVRQILGGQFRCVQCCSGTGSIAAANSSK